MARIHTPPFRVPPISAALALAAALTAPSAAQVSSEFIELANSIDPLQYSNGDQFDVGRFNSAHIAWISGGLPKYTSSMDGNSWTSTEVIEVEQSKLATLSCDTDGTVCVAYVTDFGSDGLGSIRYARRAWGATDWTIDTVVAGGTQPDIEVRAGTVHLVWTTVDRIQYISFPTDEPPTEPVVFGEEIEVNTCANSGFVRPSVALAREDCEEIVKVAYLRYSDETDSTDGACVSIMTEVGPRVCSRDVDGNWSLEWDDLITEIDPAETVEPYSLSLNAHYTTGTVYLAWSDSSNGVERSVVGRGREGVWDTELLADELRAVHIAAGRRRALGQFRVAWATPDDTGLHPIYSNSASHRTGFWNEGEPLSWLEAEPVPLIAQWDSASVGPPQAAFWHRCSNGTYTTIESVYPLEGACNDILLSTLIRELDDCPSTPILPFNPCLEHALEFATFSDGVITHVDTSKLGELVIAEPSRAIFRGMLNGRRVMVELRWSGASLQDRDHGRLILDGPAASIAGRGAGIDVRQVNLRVNRAYLRARVPNVCRR